ncbi:MAG: hypothetical protein FWH05_08445, partial [Oscillospiraceae bacterium]|nr:hypothetical protein [Oscillospiraceae bacterium]
YKMLDLLRNSNITRFIIDELLKFICKFKSVVRPGRSFARNFSSCKHPVQYRKHFFGAGGP